MSLRKVEVYQPDTKVELPEYLFFKGDQLYVREEGKAEGSPGPYDRVWDFGAVLFSPKRGGELVAQFFELFGDFPKDKIVDYELKRVVMENGTILAGVRNFDFSHKIDKETTVIFGDDCLASYISAYVTLDLVRSLAKEPPKWFVVGMTSEYYLLRLPDEGFPENTYAVGDMGLWTRALPTEFNSKAPWNTGRPYVN